jgi:hypothetical protein
MQENTATDLLITSILRKLLHEQLVGFDAKPAKPRRQLAHINAEIATSLLINLSDDFQASN